ncbi:cation-binding protein [Candidatus Woesearchaeota archaeon]|nr:cation-binding protein [Candidatus Woesearchaeota archaeon]
MALYMCPECGDESKEPGRCPGCDKLREVKHVTKPFGPLMAEHRVIEKGVAMLAKEAQRLQENKDIDNVFIVKIIDFFRIYADKCHHGKEEDILFARLKDKDIPKDREDMMNGLIDDHKKARQLIGELEKAGQKNDADTAAGMMKELSELYPDHIDREDNHFFIPVMDHFTDDEKYCMIEEFNDFDRKQIHDKYRQVAEDMEKEMSDKA